MKLNPRQQKFCDEYLIDLNGKQSAIRAGYSAKTAEVKASQLLSLIKVQSYIAELQKQLQERTNVTIDDVVKELIALSFFDIRLLYDDNGRMLEPHELSDSAAKAISGFKSRREVVGSGEDKEVNIIDEYKTYDKPKTLDMLMRYFGGYEKDNHQNTTNIIIEAKEPNF